MKKKLTFGRKLLLPALGLLLGLGGFATETQASHFRYGNLAWKPTGNPGEVEFNFQFGVARSSMGNPNIGQVVSVGTFTFGDGQSTSCNIKVTALDVAADWVVGELVVSSANPVPVRKTYSGAGPFLAGFNTCCRLSNLANRGDGSLVAQSMVTPLNGNSSPVSSMVPIVNVPASPAASFFVPAIDPDGDGLRWRIANEVESTGFDGGVSTAPPGMTINPLTGQVTWDTSTLDQSRFWTVQFAIEDVDLNGIVKTKSAVDVLLRIGAQVGSAPQLEVHTTDPSNLHGPLTVVANKPAVLTIDALDLDANNTLTLNAGGLPSGAVVTPQLPITGSTNLSATFNWTPTLAQVGSHGITFSVTDETGLQTLSSMTINVISGATLAGDESYSTAKDTTLTVPAPGVLANDSDEGGNPLTAVLSSNPSHGSVTLSTNGSFVYIPNSGYTGPDEFRYRAYNGSSYSLFATVSIEVSAANAVPTDIVLSNSSVGENQAAGTTVGSLSAVDSDAGDTHTFSLVSGAGSTNNPSFSITAGGVLETTASFDFEKKNSYSIRVRVTDAGGATFEKQLTISVTDVEDGTVLYGKAQGIYMGLFNEADDVRHNTSGRFYIKITAVGNYSARAVVGGLTRRFTGTLNSSGGVTVTNLSGYVLSMQVDNSTATISGTIRRNGNQWTSDLFAYKNLYTRSNPTPLAGAYTLALENNSPAAGTPSGAGVFLVRIRGNGRAYVGGFLGDGLAARSVSIISTNGQIPFFANLFGGAGSCLGWLNVTNAGKITGDVSCIRLAKPGFYPNGYTNTISAVSSKLNPVGAFPDFLTGDSVFTGPDLLTPLLNPTLSYQRRFPTYGRISGTVAHPTSGEAMIIRVVVLQNQNKAVGYYTTPTKTGSVVLQGN